MAHLNQRVVTIGLLALGVLIVAVYFLSRSPSQPPVAPMNSVRNEDLWGEKIIDEGIPLPGRPLAPLPLTTKAFSDLRLSLDGRTIGDELIVLKAGQNVLVNGWIKGNERFFKGPPPHPIMHAGLGLACRSENAEGWMIIYDRYYGGSQSRDEMTFEGSFSAEVPPGEYALVVLYSAFVGSGTHPIMMAAQYDAIVE